MLKARQATTVDMQDLPLIYVRQAERVNFRGRSKKNCEVCGELLESWHGRRTPTFKLVKRGGSTVKAMAGPSGTPTLSIVGGPRSSLDSERPFSLLPAVAAATCVGSDRIPLVLHRWEPEAASQWQMRQLLANS